MKLNKPSEGHGINGANKSNFKPRVDKRRRREPTERERAEAFYRQRQQQFKQLRAAQEAARCGK